MCEAHFENQILDYATRKILVRNAQPASLEESKYNNFPRDDQQRTLRDFEHVDLDEEDDDYADGKCFVFELIIFQYFVNLLVSVFIDVDEEYLKGLTPQVIITKTEPTFENDDPDNSMSFTGGDYNDCK